MVPEIKLSPKNWRWKMGISNWKDKKGIFALTIFDAIAITYLNKGFPKISVIQSQMGCNLSIYYLQDDKDEK